MNLDDDLAGWAAAVRLPAADADAIFQRITAPPAAAVTGARAGHVLATTAPGLDPAWWRRQSAAFAAAMVAATAPVRYAA